MYNILFTFLLIFSVHTFQEEAKDCSQYNNNCRICAMVPGCGYCDKTRKCVDGDAIAPTDPFECSSQDWNPCSKVCGGKFVCKDCLLSGCGWCESPGTSANCIFGDTKGPLNATCNHRWIYGNTDKCPQDVSCFQHAYCDTCVQNDQCGWCESTHRCVPGMPSGPSTGKCEQYMYYSCPQRRIAWWVWVLVVVLVGLLVGLCVGIFIRRRRRHNKLHKKIQDEEAKLIFENEDGNSGSYSLSVAP